MERIKEGSGVDSEEGFTEGSVDGNGNSITSVGDDVGSTDGSSEGIWDGLSDGRRLGSLDGTTDKDDEGLLEDLRVADGVGTSKEGDGVGTTTRINWVTSVEGLAEDTVDGNSERAEEGERLGVVKAHSP